MKFQFISFLIAPFFLLTANNEEPIREHENDIQFTHFGETEYQKSYLLERGDVITFTGECFSFGIFSHPEDEMPWTMADHLTDYITSSNEWEFLIRKDVDEDPYNEKVEINITVSGPAFVHILFIPLDFKNTAQLHYNSTAARIRANHTNPKIVVSW